MAESRSNPSSIAPEVISAEQVRTRDLYSEPLFLEYRILIAQFESALAKVKMSGESNVGALRFAAKAKAELLIAAERWAVRKEEIRAQLQALEEAENLAKSKPNAKKE